MTDITDTPETDDAAGAEAPEAGNEMAAADLPMVDQEHGDEDDDGEPIVPNGRITLQELNEKTPADLVAFADQHGMPVFHVQHVTPAGAPLFAEDSERYAALFRHLLGQGVYLAPSQFEAMFVSLAHGDEEIERTVDAVAGFGG